MKPYVAVVGLLLWMALGVVPVLADTKKGNANRSSRQFWTFVNSGVGETKITLSWTKAGSHVLMLLICDPTDPLVFGAAGAGLDRYAELIAGLPPGAICLVSVTALSGPATPYRIHLNQTISEASSGAGRMPRSATNHELQALREHAEQKMNQLKRSVIRGQQ